MDIGQIVFCQMYCLKRFLAKCIKNADEWLAKNYEWFYCKIKQEMKERDSPQTIYLFVVPIRSG